MQIVQNSLQKFYEVNITQIKIPDMAIWKKQKTNKQQQQKQQL